MHSVEEVPLDTGIVWFEVGPDGRRRRVVEVEAGEVCVACCQVRLGW